MTTYEDFVATARRAADLYHAAAVLQWDEEVFLPAGASRSRSRQLATLAAMAHELLTSEAYGAGLRQLIDDRKLDPAQQANVVIALEDFEKSSKLPASLVARLSEATSQGFMAWQEARSKSDFSIFLPFLRSIIELKQEEAERYGYGEKPYDALLDEYERGATTRLLDPVFHRIHAEMPVLLQEITARPEHTDSFLYQHFPKQQQWDFSVAVLSAMGYDWNCGRQDYAAHPFTTSFGPDDVRITTRVDEENFAALFWSSVHEGGHALYEQGLPIVQYGLPLGRAASLSIHESQSRLWENGIARSRSFWEHWLPRLQQYFPQQLNKISASAFYQGCNRVEPSLIRTEADEVSYHLHVAIRYELEQELIGGSLRVEDLPDAWNASYEKRLGLCPPNDALGVLQDVHWSHGSFGYFPTYTLGSIYGVQFLEQAKQDVPGCDRPAADGSYAPLLGWLREKVHQHGARYRSEELCTRITGRGLDVDLFFQYLHQKFLDP